MTDPIWREAWTERIQPYIHLFESMGVPDLVAYVASDPKAASYVDKKSVM